MSNPSRLVQIVAFPGWVVGITRQRSGYRCWVLTPEHVVLSDGEQYASEEDAIAAGRTLVELSMAATDDQGQRHQTDF